MSCRDQINALTPRLRRYARALVAAHPAPNSLADDLVRAALQLMANTKRPWRWFDLEIRAYTALTDLHREFLRNSGFGAGTAFEKCHSCASGLVTTNVGAALTVPRDKLSSALSALALEDREALLLVVIEGFGYARAMRILKISRSVLITRLSRARGALSKSLNAQPPVRLSKSRPPHLRLVK